MTTQQARLLPYLYVNADPSIILRAKREVQGGVSEAEARDLYEKIEAQPRVKTVFASQKEDGWFGNAFHGASAKHGAGMLDNMEVGLRYLCEKGYTKADSRIARAVSSIVSRGDFHPAYLSKPPLPPDDDYTYTAWSQHLMRSPLLIRAGYEDCLEENDFIDLRRDIKYSLSCFRAVLSYDSADEVLETRRGKTVFQQGTLWPSIYDLRMLAHSRSWRNEDNYEMLAASLERLLTEGFTDEMVYTYRHGQLTGPCFALIGQHLNILGFSKPGDVSLDALELLARCGLISRVEVIREKYDYLLSLIDAELNVALPLDYRDLNWGPYHGFALSQSWRRTVDKRCDVLFRILLIDYYKELYDGH